MKIMFSARHFEATEKLRDFANDEMRKLKKYFDGILLADVVFEENGASKKVELRLNMLGKTLTSKQEGDDFYKLMPKAVEKLEKQIQTTKSKAFAH